MTTTHFTIYDSVREDDPWPVPVEMEVGSEFDVRFDSLDDDGREAIFNVRVTDLRDRLRWEQTRMATSDIPDEWHTAEVEAAIQKEQQR